MTTPNPGLEGIVVAETRLSEVDGEAGRLLLAGHCVESLSGHLSFEAVANLFDAATPGARPPETSDSSFSAAAEVRRMRAALGRARVDAFERIPALGDALDAADAMDAVRAAVGHLPESDPSRTDLERLTGAVAVFAAAWMRRHRGLDPVPPDPRRGHAADYLAMLHGRPRAEAQADALDAYLCAVVDHGMNASTFAARVVASTASDSVSAVVAALGALKGRLHGGAPGPVLDMLDAVSNEPEPGAAQTWLTEELEAGRRIMGMGHRVYRVRDPRAAVLERAVEALEASGEVEEGSSHRLALARAVEREAESLLAARKPDRPLRANVEFYTAILLEALGIPRTLFTPTFAVARVVGWCAHVEEQRRTGRLIRPRARYVGPRSPDVPPSP